MTRTIKTFMVLMLAMLSCGVAKAQTQMTFYEPHGYAIAVWNLQDVSKVTFEGGDIVVTYDLWGIHRCESAVRGNVHQVHRQRTDPDLGRKNS